MFSKLKRIGTKSCKVQLNIDLKELDIFNEREDITLVCIELKRGSKSISSSSKLWSQRESLTIKFDDQIALLMTLYKDSIGKYIEKRGNLVLNGHSKVTNSSVVLGSVDLKLNLLASDFEAQKLNFVFTDSNGTSVASLTAIATSKFVGDGTADDDESSNMSGVSNQSYTQTKDVRYGSVYRDNSEKIDPEISTETTEKFRNNILKRSTCTSPSQDDGGAFSDGYEIFETSSRKSKRSISKQVGSSPRAKHAFAFGPKHEEIADLYRELEQANRRAATAQQEQRNIAALIAADTRKHEDSVYEFRKKIDLLQSEIEGLTSASNIAQRGDIDYIYGDEESFEAQNIAADEGLGESNSEELEELRSLVESLRRKLKDSMSNEMTTASELTRLQAILMASKKREADCAVMALRTAAIEDISGAAVEADTEVAAVSRMSSDHTILMGSETSVLTGHNGTDKDKDTASLLARIVELTDELAIAHKSQGVLEAVVSSRDAELAALKEERSQVTAGLSEILSQNEKLTSVCDELKRTISEKEREKEFHRHTSNGIGASTAESEAIEDLQIQLAIKRVSENSLLLKEMQDLREEVDALQHEKSLNTDLAVSLTIAGEKYAELFAAKTKVENSLEASNRTVVSLAGDVEVLRELVTDLYRKVAPDKTVEITDLRRRMTDAKIKFDSEIDNEDLDGGFHSDVESWDEDLRVSSRSTSADLGPVDSTGELDIEKLILESEEELLRVKEKRVGFKQSKLLRRDCTDKVGEKSASVSRKREIAALIAQNFQLEDKLFKSESERLLLTVGVRAAESGGSAENETDRQPIDRSYDSPRPADPHNRDALYIGEDCAASSDPDPADSTCSSTDHDQDQDQDRDQESHLVEKIFALENSVEVEKRKFEGRIQILLKATGMYDSTYSNFIAGTDHSDDRWKEVVRAQSDIERKKVMTLKTCLMRFSSKLTADEVDELEDYGVVLAPRSNPRSRNRGLNLGSALCFV